MSSSQMTKSYFSEGFKPPTSDGWAPGFPGVGWPPVAPLRPLRLRALERRLPGAAAGGAAAQAPGAAGGGGTAGAGEAAGTPAGGGASD